MLKTSQNGINFIKQHEGLYLRAYNDGVGVCTIGYGHTGSDVHYGETISEAEAEILLRKDLVRFENFINSLGVQLNQNQFDAMVSFTFNVGEGGLSPNCNAGKCFRKRDWNGLADSMRCWIGGGSNVREGLLKRRNDEIKLFNSESKTNLNVVSNNQSARGEYFDMSRTFKNGRTEEKLWNNNFHEIQTGYLDPYEECKCIAIHESGHAVLMYTGRNGYDKVGMSTCKVKLCNDGIVRPID